MNDSDRYIEESLNNAPPLSNREREMILKYKGENLRPSITARVADYLRLEVDALGEAMQKFSVLVAREVPIYELTHRLSLLYSQRQDVEVLYDLLVRHEAREEAYLEFLREDIEAIDKLAEVMADTFKQVEARSEKGVHVASLVWARYKLGEDRWWLPKGE